MSFSKKKKVKHDTLNLLLGGFLFIIAVIVTLSLTLIKPDTSEIEALAKSNTLEHIKKSSQFSNNNPVIIEFADLQCPACATHHRFMKEFLEDNPNITFEFKHFPLNNIHKNAELMAKYSIAIQTINPKRFWIFLDNIYRDQQTWSKMDQGDIHIYVKKLLIEKVKVNYNMVFKRLESKTVLAKLASDKLEAKSLKLRGTPTFLLNGKIIETPAPNSKSWNKLIGN